MLLAFGADLNEVDFYGNDAVAVATASADSDPELEAILAKSAVALERRPLFGCHALAAKLSLKAQNEIKVAAARAGMTANHMRAVFSAPPVTAGSRPTSDSHSSGHQAHLGCCRISELPTVHSGPSSGTRF
jgi:hypothetical protein